MAFFTTHSILLWTDRIKIETQFLFAISTYTCVCIKWSYYQ